MLLHIPPKKLTSSSINISRMKLALIGFGQAGGKIVDKFLEYESQVSGPNVVVGAMAVNTAKADLMGLEYIPEDNRVLIGQDKVKGHGVGADNELGAEIAERDVQEIHNKLDRIETSKVDAFLIVAGLGGGTGSGGMPVLAKSVKRIYTEPVYSLGILPSEDEGGIYSLNAARSFQQVVEQSDNTILFDNNSWAQTGESMGEGYEYMNTELVKRMYMLFSAGEVIGGDTVGESVVDASEIINTLGSGGISTIGFAETQLSEDEIPGRGGLLSRFRNTEPEIGDSSRNINRITSVIRKAALGRLTHPAEISGIERALVVIAGPPELLSRKGIEKSRKWIEEETSSMEVRGGDYPLEGYDKIAGVVLLSGVTQSDRIKRLQQIAIEAQETTKELEEDSKDKLDELIDPNTESDDDELESLF